MIPEIVEVPISDNIAELLEIASNLLKRLPVSILLRDKSPSTYNDRRKHAVKDL